MSLRRNTIWNLVGSGLPLILGVVTIPYIMQRVGVEAFGILTLVWALIGYFSLFDMGMGRALTQQVAFSLSNDDSISKLPGLVKTGLLITVITGLAGGIIFALLSDKLSTEWLNVSPILQKSTYRALVIASIGIPITTITTGLRGILEAFEDFGAVNLIRVALGAANFGLPALSVMFVGNSLEWMVAGLIIARVAALSIYIVLVNRRLVISWRSNFIEKKYVKKLTSFGAWMTVSTIVSPLMVTADRFIVASMLGADLVAFYTVPAEALSRILVLPGSITTALFPRLATLNAKNKSEAVRLYQKSLKAVALMLLPICLVIGVGSKYGLTIWLGSDFAEKSWLIVSIMTIGLFFNGVAYVAFAAVQAKGGAKITAMIHLIELLFYLPILIGLLEYFGLVGAAIAWTIRAGVDLIVLLIYANRRIL